MSEPFPHDEAGLTSPENGKKEQEVRIGQLFPLFPQGLTRRIIRENKPSEYDSHTTLVSPTGDRLRFLIAADNHSLDPIYPIVAPFRPETGYRIDAYDFDEVAGPYKYSQWLRTLDPSLSDPLLLHLTHSGHEEDGAPPGSDTTYQMLNTLQLQVIANDLLVQAGNKKGSLAEYNRLSFDSFYPMDTGPLPYLPDGGFGLYLPDDLTKLRTVQARFVLPKQV